MGIQSADRGGGRSILDRQNQARQLGPKPAHPVSGPARLHRSVVVEFPGTDAEDKGQRMNAHILVVDDEAPTRELLSIFFKRRGCTVTTASTGADALRLVNELPVRLLILDIELGEELSGLDLLEPIKKNRPELAVILFSGIVLAEQ